MSLTTFKAAISALLPSGKTGGIIAADHRSANEAMINKMYLPEGLGFPCFGDSIPEGFHAFDGGELSRTSCPLLFALWGTKYGPGDGSTTFNCPAIDQGGSPVQKGAKIAVGAKGGAMEHTNTLEEMASHAHNFKRLYLYSRGVDTGGYGYRVDHEGSEDTQPAGGGKVYSIMNPYIGVNWVFRLE